MKTQTQATHTKGQWQYALQPAMTVRISGQCPASPKEFIVEINTDDAEKDKANAQLIVRAVNMHNELIEAIEQEMEYLEEWNGIGNYTERIEILKLLIKKANNMV